MPLAQLDDVVLNHVCLEASPSFGGVAGDVVMVHGLGANLGFWYLRIAPALAKRSRVTLFDLRGHGLSSMPPHGYGAASMAADMRALFDHVGIESAHLVGHSFGGSVAMRFACENRSRVRSLTLLDTRLRALQPRLRANEWPYWPRYRNLMNEIGLKVDDGECDVGIQFFDHMARMRVEDSDRLEKLTATTFRSIFAGKSGKRSAQHWLRLRSTTSAREDFLRNDDVVLADMRSLRIPIVGIYGEYSHALSTARMLPQLCPQAQIEVVPSAGHFFPVNTPERVIDPVSRLLDLDAAELPQAGMWPNGHTAAIAGVP